MPTPRLERVVSGGQTGVDQAALRAAKAAGLATGGWMPLGFLTEDGRRPDMADAYGMKAARTPDSPTRTRMNAKDSSATIWLGPTGCAGWVATAAAVRRYGRPMLVVEPGVTTPRMVADFLTANRVRTLNIAGPRESTSPGIGERAEAFLARLFRMLAQEPTSL
ncbi:YpsA SLOG family protein [Paludisphaera rhizosphaerae]|uniref:YpsA SLOG family protein n=1 Tax=Paludisphaera rhizosphaerae TaxID=2711216 RepID=UPI0013EB9D13|nr:putative molybdenum carrier protein [Paludisphaera rhizosphaerae]